MDGDVYELTFWTQHSEQVCVMKRHWVVEGQLGNGPTQAQIVTAIDDVVAPLMKAVLSASASYIGAMAARVFPIPRLMASKYIVNAGVGLVAGEIMPRQVRGIFTLTTGFAGRAFRGRSYTPFPSEQSNDTNATPTAGFLASLNALATGITQTFVAVGAGGNTADLEPVIAKFVSIGNVSVLSDIMDITGYVTRDRWATQRKSGSYGAPNVSPF